MSVQETIETKIRAALSPAHLEVTNESHMHNVPPGSESHFKVVVVSPDFEAKNRVQRHQAMNALLADELAGPVHALSMQTHTQPEWEARGGKIFESPACHGGSQADQ
ncbi:MAG: BolA/IbaG family iron-sulfur metabolism protein [Rhodospirillaceae bacterium]|nr:BolA/IbaG family iron-sulfur metabolism protein [Rhodospirillaceae bacterium]